MEDIILTYISQELVNKPEVLPLNNDSSLLEAGILDSLSLLKLLLFLEENFDILMDDVDVVPENFDTVTSICKYIRSH
jgi:acyl carrier protein